MNLITALTALLNQALEIHLILPTVTVFLVHHSQCLSLVKCKCVGIILHLLLCALQKYCHQLDLRCGAFITVINVIQKRQEDTQVTWLEGDALIRLEIVLEDTVRYLPRFGDACRIHHISVIARIYWTLLARHHNHENWVQLNLYMPRYPY